MGNEYDTDSDNDDDDQKDTIGQCLVGVFPSIKIKQSVIIFIVFILITSTTGVNLLGRIDGNVKGGIPTLQGVFAQGICLALAYIVIDMAVTAKLV